jgi:hypothetical protein
MAELVHLTVVPNVYEADMVCALLRTERIDCDHRPTNMGAAITQGMPSAGPREVLVDETQLERAQEIFAASRDA